MKIKLKKKRGGGTRPTRESALWKSFLCSVENKTLCGLSFQFCMNTFSEEEFSFNLEKYYFASC